MPLIDNSGIFADDLAHDGTVTVVDLGDGSYGAGREHRIHVKGDSIAGATGITITDGATDTAGDALMTVKASVAEINAGLDFALPSHVSRYVKLELEGSTSAGTWSAFLTHAGGPINP